MENNFFVGIVCHERRAFKPSYNEKVVLYSDDYVEFVNLQNGEIYNFDKTRKNYVLEETLVTAEASDFRDDYLYLLFRYKNRKSNKSTKMKLKTYQSNFTNKFFNKN